MVFVATECALLLGCFCALLVYHLALCAACLTGFFEGLVRCTHRHGSVHHSPVIQTSFSRPGIYRVNTSTWSLASKGHVAAVNGRRPWGARH